jgi:membrane protein implicated in regulation of membrane protease activity
MFPGIPGTCSSKAISAIVVAMKNNYEYGIEGVIGKEAKVVSKLGSLSDAQYLVKIRGELWSADSDDDLKPGDKVKILSANELILVVEKVDVE